MCCTILLACPEHSTELYFPVFTSVARCRELTDYGTARSGQFCVRVFLLAVLDSVAAALCSVCVVRSL